MNLSLLALRFQKLFYSLRRPFLWRALSRGVFPSIELIRVSVWLHDPGITYIFDVGANMGQFTLLLLSLGFAKNQSICCFEPLPSAVNALQRNLKDFPGISIYQCALGSCPGQLPIHVASAEDSSSLLLPSPLQSQVYGVKSVGLSFPVSVCTLDKFLVGALDSGFLKIDVQGYELEVLKGCVQLSAYFKYILLEASFVPLYEGQPLVDDILDYMRFCGYRLLDVFNIYRSRVRVVGPVQMDLLFIRAK